MRIREIRKIRGMSQKELAEAIGVNTSVISKYETESVAPPTKRLLAIADVLDVTLSELTEEQPCENGEDIFVRYIEKTAYEKSYLNRMIRLGTRGYCELCEKEAPFNDKYGRPFLFVYSINEGCDDEIPEMHLVALCPNCFAKVTVCKDSNDIQKLKEKAKKHQY